MSAIALAQSQPLGDIARENREKKEAEESSGTPPKVFTNATLPKDENATGNAPNTATPATSSPNSPFSEKDMGQPPSPQSAGQPTDRQRRARQRAAEQRAAQQRANEQRVAAEWKSRVLQQKAVVANLRLRVDRMKASIRFADPNYQGNGSTYDYYSALNYNRWQAQRLQRLQQLQQQLDGEKRKLEDLQEAARHAGMHTGVYDP